MIIALPLTPVPLALACMHTRRQRTEAGVRGKLIVLPQVPMEHNHLLPGHALSTQADH